MYVTAWMVWMEIETLFFKPTLQKHFGPQHLKQGSEQLNSSCPHRSAYSYIAENAVIA